MIEKLKMRLENVQAENQGLKKELERFSSQQPSIDMGGLLPSARRLSSSNALVQSQTSSAQ
jgi:hypothetical protein